jgi:hypothetical protein
MRDPAQWGRGHHDQNSSRGHEHHQPPAPASCPASCIVAQLTDGGRKLMGD